MNKKQGRIDPKEMKSDEERMFYSWLLEAEANNLCCGIEYQPISFSLSDRATTTISKTTKGGKIKTVERFLAGPHVYTPDFWFRWYGPSDTFKTTRPGMIYVDTKGTGSRFHDDKSFSINQKWTLEKHGIWVEKVVPKKFFHLTWCPTDWVLTPKQKKPAKAFLGCASIKEYMKPKR